MSDQEPVSPPHVADAIMDLTDITLTDEMTLQLLEKPVVPYLHFSGLSQVHRSVLKGEMDTIVQCRTMKDLLREVERARYRWTTLGVFNDIKLSFEPISDGTAKDVCVHFHVDEKKPSKQVGVFTTETSVPEVTASLNNLLNSRYTFSGRYTPPAARSHAFSLSLTSNVPFFGRTAEYYAGIRREDRPMNLAEAEKIEEVKVVTSNVEKDSSSQFTLGIQRRNTASRDRYELPQNLQAELGESIKLYASHQYHVSSEEYHVHPFLFSLYPLAVRGSSCFIGNEVGVDPTTKNPVYRGDLQWLKHYLLHPLVVLDINVRLGVAASPTGHVPLSDRLFLGWRHVRGFKSIGPSTDGLPVPIPRYAATGGNVLWATAASLNFPVPFLPSNGLLSMHLFANVGNCDYIGSTRNLQQRAFNLFRDASCSVGGGLVVTQIPFFGVLPSGRFEFNLSAPLKLISDGQFPIGLDDTRRGLFDKWRFGLVWSSSVSD